MKKVLVTGGTGFLGSALVSGLVKKGYFVKVFDNNFRGNNNRLSRLEGNIEIIEGDIRNDESVLSATKGVDWVFHLAFVNGTRHFYERPELVLDVGIRGALTTMDAAMKVGVEKYIIASSSEVYQEPEKCPTNESERIIIPNVNNPRFSYSGGKIISELLAFHYLKGIEKRIIFRPHNIYGPDMGWEHVIPEFMKRVRTIERGTTSNLDFPIQGTGEETRAFCYVKDAVDGIILSAEKGEDLNIYHIGVDEEIKISDLAMKVGQLAGFNLNLINDELRPGGTLRRCPDIAKIKKLGYSPSVSLSSGLKKCWSWYSNAPLPKENN